jgi:hypothetical protein
LSLDENTRQVKKESPKSNCSQQDLTAFYGADGEEFSVTREHEIFGHLNIKFSEKKPFP